ncbi:MAG: L,D-transpeptidase family protein [Roseomonas sp.]|nr:L,D-transpeptidase family protein [Roseomonas sp.]MCA3381199.1 L,D-transpeptidase family protein [Roseomonas sp.]
MSDSKRFAGRRAMLGLGVAGLAGGMPPLAHAASRAALDHLAHRLEALTADGLDPRHYDLPENIAMRGPAGVMARAEAALRDLVLGRVAALPGRADIKRDPARVDFPAWRERLLASTDPASVLDQAAALHPDAAPIRAELARFRAIAARGGWPLIEGNLSGTLEPGSQDAARVGQLRARLAVLDPEVLRGVAAENPFYDARLQASVRRFQAEEGLEADGRIGRLTWAALNTPVAAKIGQLRVALDMRRGLAAPPDRRIEVNIPHFRLKLTDAGRVVQDMAVVVGRPDRQTPVLDVRLVAVQFNPPWGVPDRNAREDLLPRFRRDPGRMQAMGYRLYQRIDGELTEIDATTLDFSAYSKDRFPFIIRQDPGEVNALGRIKFVMPNRDDIFMHDTPDRHLFRRPDRAFSSGCIRLERPMDLLAEAFSGMPAWDRERFDRVLETGATQGVTLARAIPVRLHYDTVIVEAGNVVMRRDIYGLDAAYLRALDAPRSERLAEALPRP